MRARYISLGILGLVLSIGPAAAETTGSTVRLAPHRAVYDLSLARSSGAFHVDYGYHLAPIQRSHVGEMEALVQAGVPSFKIFMFYGSHGLHGRSSSQRDFLRLEDDHAFINLRAPIVINPRRMLGLQLVSADSPYATDHPLLLD